jgi:hypothetical protein
VLYFVLAQLPKLLTVSNLPPGRPVETIELYPEMVLFTSIPKELKEVETE